jgi:hypothetical protein
MAILIKLIDNDKTFFYPEVVGHILVAVQKHEDGSLTIERDIQVNANNVEDNAVVEDFIKKVQAKLDEALPEPEVVPEAKLWVPE